MKAPSNGLEDYEEAIETLLGEIRKYQSVNNTLRGMASNLSNIQELNAAAGKSLWSIAAEASQILKTIQSIKLGEMEARTSAQYTAHQESLERLASEVQHAVREQQRLGFEMLQHTTASQKQFESFVSHSRQSVEEHERRDEHMQQLLRTFSTGIDEKLGRLAQQTAIVISILVVVAGLVFILGAVTVFR